MKLPSIMRRKKLQASTARRSRALGLPDSLDYEQMSEPNMKLSRALLIVLVLHIVAVAGIIAFNTIKTRETMTAGPPDADTFVPPAAASAALTTNAQPAADQPNEVTRVAATPEQKVPEKTAEHAKPVSKTPVVPDSGKIYTVVKGDNPVTIARHLKVAEADLLELNQITDPRKLQIGTKLHIPAQNTTSKGKSD
jgi:LysM repeat protein